MNKELRLLNRVLQDKDLHPLFERGVNDTWFADDSMRRVWSFIRKHFNSYGECPSATIIEENFPTFTFETVSESLDYLIDEVQSAKRKLATNAMIREAIEQIEKHQDHERALQALQSGMLKLEEDGLNGSRDVDLTVDPMQRFAEYEELKNLPNGLRGYPTGFPTIDKATSGLQKGQLVTIVAPPKTGKSTLALQIASNVHLNGAVPMFQSFEMTNREQLNRYDAMRARISHFRLQSGMLTSDEEVRYKAKLKSLEQVDKQFWLAESTGDYTVSNIISKIQTLSPDVVFIDGMYLMTDEQSGEANTPQALTNITRSLKKVAQKYNVPIVISTQALTWKMKKGQVTADSVGYSSSFFQDSDVMFGLQREDENVDDTRLLKVLASRNTGPAEVSLLWDWNTGQFREITEEDL